MLLQRNDTNRPPNRLGTKFPREFASLHCRMFRLAEITDVKYDQYGDEAQYMFGYTVPKLTVRSNNLAPSNVKRQSSFVRCAMSRAADIAPEGHHCRLRVQHRNNDAQEDYFAKVLFFFSVQIEDRVLLLAKIRAITSDRVSSPGVVHSLYRVATGRGSHQRQMIILASDIQELVGVVYCDGHEYFTGKRSPFFD
jgi:hypothetical protein